MRRILVSCLLISAMLAIFHAQAGSTAGEEPAKPLEWRWSDEKATLAFCIKQHLPDYDIERVRPEQYYSPMSILDKDTRKVIYSYERASKATVFARSKDVLYIAEYFPITTGCEVVAVDLISGKQLWKTRLIGNSPDGHSKYENKVNIETDGNIVIVNGKEDHGRYVEHLDIRTGKMLRNKKLNPE